MIWGSMHLYLVDLMVFSPSPFPLPLSPSLSPSHLYCWAQDVGGDGVGWVDDACWFIVHRKILLFPNWVQRYILLMYFSITRKPGRTVNYTSCEQVVIWTCCKFKYCILHLFHCNTKESVWTGSDWFRFSDSAQSHKLWAVVTWVSMPNWHQASPCRLTWTPHQSVCTGMEHVGESKDLKFWSWFRHSFECRHSLYHHIQFFSLFPIEDIILLLILWFGIYPGFP